MTQGEENMPPHKPPHKHRDDDVRDREGRIFNTPENAASAVTTGRSCIKSLAPGKVWTMRAPHGELEIKGSLVLNDSPVIVLHFNPEDGSLLPKGLHGLSEGKPEIISQVQARLSHLLQQIAVLEGAEFREPESCWAIPVAHQGRIVGHLKVSSDGSTILPDRKAAEELSRSK
jgi:hypothetical protein